jgi:putative hydroxymethylpyrimidine transport system substrate-binding protein
MLAWPVPSHAADRLTVMLEWFVNPDHAPMIVAQQKGLFEAAGLDVELIPPADPSSVPRLVAARQADVGVHYQPNLYLDHAAGLPLVRFGTLVETPLNTVTVLADGPVKTLADLKGRKIGFSVSGFEDAMLKRMLAAEGVALDEVELVNVNFALTSSLLGGQVDATVGGFRNFELTQIRLAGGEARSFFPEEHGVPVYDELIFIAHKDLNDEPPAAVPRRGRRRPASSSPIIRMKPGRCSSPPIPISTTNSTARLWIDTLPRFAKRPACARPEVAMSVSAPFWSNAA